jgi:hypothetical protein
MAANPDGWPVALSEVGDLDGYRPFAEDRPQQQLRIAADHVDPLL